MFRANSNNRPYNRRSNDDDDDDDNNSEASRLNNNNSSKHGEISDMLQALSAEYSTSYDQEDDGDEEEGAIGDQDQQVDITFKDDAELAWNQDAQGGFDLFQLVPKDSRTSRRIDPKFWSVSVTVPTTTRKNPRSKRNNNNNNDDDDNTANHQQTAQENIQKKSKDNDDDTQESQMGVKEKTITLEITAEEGVEIFEQEVDSCRLVYGEENVVVVDNNDPTSLMRTVRVQVISTSDLEEANAKRNARCKGLWISFLKPVRYPIAPLEPFVEPWHNLFTFKEAQQIYSAMIEVVENNVESPCLFNMVQTATLLASTFILEGDQKIDDAKRDYIAETMKKAGYNVRLAHEKLSPSYFTGPVSGFLNLIPKGFDVMYVENVMRADLAKRYEAMQRHLFKTHVASKLQRSSANSNQNADDFIDINHNILKTDKALAELCESKLVFHGTRMGSIEGIVGKGFLVPGQDKNSGVKVRCGSRYGNGIYSSNSMDFALGYAERGRRVDSSVKVLVCGLLPGKVNMIMDGEEPWGGGLIDPDEKGYNSHISEEGEQYVVFNHAQILPCYVLHLMERKAAKESDVADLGRGDKTDEVKRELRKIKISFGLAGDSDEEDNERVRELEKKRQAGSGADMKKKAGLIRLAEAERKKLLTALAKKNLPFGFGPAGSNFVVEEIGEYSDDDEDYDQYVAYGDHEGADPYEEYQHATIDGDDN